MIRPLKVVSSGDINDPQLTEIDVLNTQAKSLIEKDTLKALKLAKSAYALANYQNYEKGKADALFIQSDCNFAFSEFKTSIQQADAALKIFIHLRFDYEIAECLKSSGRCLLRLGEHQKALAKFSAALPVYEKLNDKSGMISILNNIGILHKLENRYDLAMEYYEKCIEILKVHPDHYNEGKIYLNIGNVYFELSEYKDALENHLKAHELFIKCGDKAGEAEACNNIGNAMMKEREFERAEEMFTHGLEIVRKIGNRISEANLLNNLSLLEKTKGNKSEAYELLNQSLFLRKQVGDELGVALALGNLATTELEFKKTVRAHHHAKLSLKIYKELNNKLGECSTCILLGRIYAKLERYKKALEVSKYSVKLAKSLNARTQVSKAYETLSFILESRRKYKKSLKFFKMHSETENELQSEYSAKELKNFMLKQQLEQTKKETEMFRQKNQEILHSLEDLKNKQKEPDLNRENVADSANIVAHDLKNYLQSIIGFSELIYNSDGQTKEDLKLYSSQIKTSGEQMMTLIKDYLQSQKLDSTNLDITKINFDLTRLISLIKERFNFNLKRKEQQLIFDSSKPCFIYADEYLINSLLENLISNSLKFSDHHKSVVVSLMENEKNIFISIKDEGPGFSEQDIQSAFVKFKSLSSRPTGGESSTGLGLYIVKRIVDLHGGTIEIKSEGKNKGAEFVITLPKL